MIQRMDFIKRHYEKVLLSVVLLGMVVYAALLPGKINQEHAALKAKLDNIIQGLKKDMPPLDLSRQEAALNKLRNPTPLIISGSHNLFNPVKWVQKPTGERIKLANPDDIGIKAVVVTKITPLKLTATYQGISGAGSPVRYKIILQDEAAPTPGGRRPISRTVREGEKNDLVRLAKVNGPPEDPTSLVLELLKSAETIEIGKAKTFERVNGYEAEMKYDLENKPFRSQRVNMKVTVDDEIHIIVDINEKGVLFQAELNRERTFRPLAAAP